MRTNQTIDVQKCFKRILKALKGEDKYIADRVSAFETDEISKLIDVEGIFNLDEKHIQYILYKALLGIGGYRIYIEDPYEKRKEKLCDITVYTPDWRESLWIEIKATGWCSDGEYKRWVRADAQKLRTLRHKGARKYLLVTSIEDGRQGETVWNDWFETELKKVVEFDSNHFGSFFSTQFRDGKRIKGYYTVCLLGVKPK